MKSKSSPPDSFTSCLQLLLHPHRYKWLLSFFILLCLLPGWASAITVTLSTSWKFQEDPTNAGINGGWHTSNFDDSTWGTKLSKQSLESQGVSFATKAEFVWFRQKITIPASSAGSPLLLSLGNFPNNDDDVWFNGVRIGGIKGYQSYLNLTDRKYSVSTGINYGGTNTIAIRLWATNYGFGPGKNGLTAGTYTVELEPYQVMARDTGGSIASERPILGLGASGQVYDLSACQKGQGFEMVFRYPTSVLTGGTAPANLTYTITDFLNNAIQTGTVAVTTGSDSIVRGVAGITSASARKIYFAGRLKATLVLKDAASGTTLSNTTVNLDRLSFYNRDNLQLSALATTYESTPYGSLKLVDSIDCSTSLDVEVHPYLQGQISGDSNNVYYRTPGVPANVAVNTIAGKGAREPSWGFFSYRIGRGTLTPGKCYLMRIEYPEDKPRYCSVGVQAGDNYYDVGWKNGISATDSYDPWPLNSSPSVWKYYDMIFALGDTTQGTGGGADADSKNGVWVYFGNSNASGAGSPGYQYLYSGGVAVATLKLYEIDPIAHAPTITLPPANLPQRTLMFDWEHQAEMVPADVVNYAKLMGYSALSPITGIKWSKANYGGVCNGYESWSIDDGGHMVANPATNPAVAPLAGFPSIHEQFLTATKNSGINYIPRFEYGGGWMLPTTARAYDHNGDVAQPNRFSAGWCANLLDENVYLDLKAYLDSFISPYTATNPQLKGALWRIRCDRMPASYGIADINLFCSETGNIKPSGYSNAQLAHWASNTAPEGNATVAESYSTWWQTKRRDFHVRIKDLLRTYRSDLVLYYYNWDQDNFSLMGPDLNAWDFTKTWYGGNKAAVWNADRTARAGFTAAQYINVISSGNFAANGTSSWPQSPRPHYALRPSLYSGASAAGIQLFGPMMQYVCYANRPEYVNYFQTTDGLAVSHSVTYDESYGRAVMNARHEANNVLPGGAPFSMAVELLSYFHGDARTLTQTSYTYGRGFADAHRRFAQAFRALPALPGTVVTGSDPDTKVRTYPTSNSTYVGVAYKGTTAKTLSVTVPGQAGKAVTNLVTGATVTATNSGSDRIFSLNSGPMELHAFIVDNRPLITSASSATATAGSPFSYQITATNTPTSFGATGLPAGLSINSSTGLISGNAAAGTYVITLSATNSTGTSTTTLTLTVNAAAAVALTHQYTFDGNFNDAVGTAHGTLNGNANISGGALQLPGYVGGVSSYGALPTSVLSGLTSATLEGWFTVQSDTFFNPIYCAGTTDTENYLRMMPNGGGNPSIPQSEFRANGGTAQKLLGPHLSTGTKYYFAVVYNAASNQHTFYLGTGGTILQSATGSMNNQNLTQVTLQNFYLGRYFSAGYGLNGSVDEFRIYNGALSSTQVTGNCGAGPTPNGAALIHKYTFNNGNMNDSVGTDHGALVGNATISGGALQLPGYVGGTSSHATLPTTVLNGLTSTTFEAWFTVQTETFYNPVYFAGTTDGNNGLDFVQNGGGSPSTPQSNFRANGGTQRTVLGSHLATGTKYYVAVVYDASTNQQILYLGSGGVIQQVTSGNMNAQNLSQLLVQKFHLGAWRTTNYALNGSVDEFRIYDGGLTSTQITANCNAGPTP